MRLIFIRPGWRNYLRPVYVSDRSWRVLRIGPCVLIVNKPLSFRNMLWITDAELDWVDKREIAP